MRRRLVEVKKDFEEALLADVVRALADHPDQVRVSARQPGDGELIMLTIHCSPRDRGRIIGKKGKTISAIRFLFENIAYVRDRKVSVRIDG